MPGSPPPTLLLAVHSSALGGASVVAAAQAEALASRYRLVIAVSRGPLFDRFARAGRIVDGPTGMPFPYVTPVGEAIQVARALRDAARLAAIVRRNRVAAIVANASTLISPVLAGRLTGTPVVVFVQEAPSSASIRRLLRFHGALADTVVAISDFSAASFDGASAHVLVSPIGIQLCPPVPPRSRTADERFEILVVGSVDRRKRQDLAISAVAELTEMGVDVGLSLVGPQPDPEYLAELEQLVASRGLRERVTVPGPSLDVPSLLHAADALLVPTGEVTPLVIMEAMAHSTPVVATAMGGVPEVVVDGKSGLLAPPDDAPAIADALRRLAQDPGLAARLAKGGRERVEAKFDGARATERLCDELERLMARRARPRLWMNGARSGSPARSSRSTRNGTGAAG